MIDVAARQGGELHDLTQRCEAAHIPLRTHESPLGVLSLVTEDSERVGLQFDPSAEDGIFHAAAVIDGRQGERDLSLLAAQNQRLRRIACDQQIAVGVDPLQLRQRAQPVVAADIVTAQEGPVARYP